MLAWIVAAACMWRGLTSDEADAVAQELTDRLDILTLMPTDLTAGEARDVLDAAIATVLERTRA
ncbi:hypothetical protein [Microbacterium sp. J1-1]|uniref:hypothetical protein n=1 Tax=Microbacterium sp. J1-1 TaxID=2992441 RepID=UPI002113AAE3|nr:hypothetical protein [Microbacterium sp. J1-1]UUE19336.1 hypothetical protein LRQ07_10995 [Microbacterium sp. J1-1]